MPCGATSRTLPICAPGLSEECHSTRRGKRPCCDVVHGHMRAAQSGSRDSRGRRELRRKRPCAVATASYELRTRRAIAAGPAPRGFLLGTSLCCRRKERADSRDAPVVGGRFTEEVQLSEVLAQGGFVFDEPLQDRGSPRLEDGREDREALGLPFDHGGDIEEVARFEFRPAVLELLGDDLRRRLDEDPAPQDRLGLPWRRRQRGWRR